jgi:hypothetical protein
VDAPATPPRPSTIWRRCGRGSSSGATQHRRQPAGQAGLDDVAAGAARVVRRGHQHVGVQHDSRHRRHQHPAHAERPLPCRPRPRHHGTASRLGGVPIGAFSCRIESIKQALTALTEQPTLPGSVPEVFFDKGLTGAGGGPALPNGVQARQHGTGRLASSPHRFQSPCPPPAPARSETAPPRLGHLSGPRYTPAHMPFLQSTAPAAAAGQEPKPPSWGVQRGAGPFRLIGAHTVPDTPASHSGATRGVRSLAHRSGPRHLVAAARPVRHRYAPVPARVSPRPVPLRVNHLGSRVVPHLSWPDSTESQGCCIACVVSRATFALGSWVRNHSRDPPKAPLPACAKKCGCKGTVFQTDPPGRGLQIGIVSSPASNGGALLFHG